MLPRLPQCNRNWFGAINRKLLLAFLLCFSALIAQDPTSYLTPEVARVGDRLACRCGGCRNTVGNCPMLHCHSADPKRQLIHEMQKAGLSDDAIVNTFVREEGVVALSSPPSGSLGGLITWVMPGVALPVSGTLRSGDLVVLHTFGFLSLWSQRVCLVTLANRELMQISVFSLLIWAAFTDRLRTRLESR